MNVISVPGLPDCNTVNVVCTFNMGVALNSTKLVLFHRKRFTVKFNDRRFAAFTVKFRADGLGEITAHVFGTGAVVLTGAFCPEDARLAAWNFVHFFNEVLDVPATVCSFTIRNIVSCFHLGFPVELGELKMDLGSRVFYDPVRFPAAILQSATDPNVTGLIYWTGNGVITGCKQHAQIRRNYISVHQIASMYPRAKAAAESFKCRDFRERQRRKLRQRAALTSVERQGKLLEFVDLFAVNKKAAAAEAVQAPTADAPDATVTEMEDSEEEDDDVTAPVIQAASVAVDAAEDPEELGRVVAEEEAAAYRPNKRTRGDKGPVVLYMNALSFELPPEAFLLGQTNLHAASLPAASLPSQLLPERPHGPLALSLEL